MFKIRHSTKFLLAPENISDFISLLVFPSIKRYLHVCFIDIINPCFLRLSRASKFLPINFLLSSIDSWRFLSREKRTCQNSRSKPANNDLLCQWRNLFFPVRVFVRFTINKLVSVCSTFERNEAVPNKEGHVFSFSEHESNLDCSVPLFVLSLKINRSFSFPFDVNC